MHGEVISVSEQTATTRHVGNRTLRTSALADNWLLAIALLAMLAVAQVGCATRPGRPLPHLENPLLDLPVKEFDIAGANIRQAVDELRFQARTPCIPVEFLTNEESLASGGVGARSISLKVADTTIRQVLSSIVSQDTRYTFVERDGRVVVIHKHLQNDATYVLNQVLDYDYPRLKGLTLQELLMIISGWLRTIAIKGSVHDWISLGGTDEPDIGVDLKGKTIRSVLLEVTAGRHQCPQFIVKDNSVEIDLD